MSKTGLRPGSTGSGRRQNEELAQALLALVGIGLAGGIALIGGAVKLGEKILDLQVRAYEKIENERETRREEIRQIADSETDFPAEALNEDLPLREE